MDIEFDPAKDAANIAKHGVSLDRAVELAGIVVVEDTRFAERRLRLYGTIDGIAHCAAVTMRGNVVRVINLRRAHRKEVRRYGF
ncbi:BrnT family toxin (plasmid) [Sphingomonas paeninsulae]|uniref:BrnT family toxin n=1 Tax=Sphingomonas paeninsulae TaxID=2319844 RepID=A0A494T8Q0_SPHPE|nr:BrnT family toxin [Sphingomonas paeninsulae]AYJ85310.1 BrnT family toxin [Sphingomonas paeninsulae]